ncbi:unnamed protein product [Adineta steineri]|uniref:Uncharacterized protein n=1 Tax=Adineta steineri TaxID=433720 RepID=A0A818KJ87_9BILA|nr:unnamed protein product [Adineta steineri]CAF3557258.1 unnamed protein product [Adineta steineri]
MFDTLFTTIIICIVHIILGQRDIEYLIFEGGGPDEGPGPNQTLNIASLKRTFGEINPTAQRMYAYGKQQMRFLTRSNAFVRSEMETAFTLAENTKTPLFIHIDPIYGWGADEENSTADAPTIKYWNNETMREWIEFPLNKSQLPNRIPRTWFNWGSWCSPSSAFPAIGAPNFINFSAIQFNESIAKPLAQWIIRLNKQNKSYLFAGINIGWETNILNYRQIDPAHLPTAVWPVNSRNITMQQWEAGAQLGYASLYWQGWTEEKLIIEAQHRNITRDILFNLLCYEIIHNYLEVLAKVCHDNNISRERIFTHIVPMASVDTSRIDTTIPPIWTAVSSYSIPGFTMDNRGAAIYNLTELKYQITIVDPSQSHFAVSESYLFNYGDEESMRDNLNEAFNNGGLIKAIYGALPFSSEDPQPAGAIKAIQQWLNTNHTLILKPNFL